MTARWHVHQLQQTLGPYGWDELADQLQRGLVVGDAMVSGPGVPWTRARDVEGIARILVERDEREGWRVTSGLHSPLPPVPDPAPGEPWFFPFSPFLAGVLYLVTLGFYTFVWRYRHVRWLGRRAGLDTIPSMGVVRDNQDLRLEIARAADRLDVPRGFRLRPRGTAEAVLPVLGLHCCPPVIPMLIVYWAIQLADLQSDANRVNRAIAPRTRNRLPGLGELLALMVALLFWAALVAVFLAEMSA